MTARTLFRGATLYLESGPEQGSLLVEGERIAAVGDIESVSNATIRELEHCAVMPGLIDLQVNGCAGVEVYDATVKAISAVLEALPRFGCTSVLLTMISAPHDRYEQLAKALIGLDGTQTGARLLGVHLEGPYLNPQHPGAHSREFLSVPDVGRAEDLLDKFGGLVKIWTVAPELPGSSDLIDLLESCGVVVAVGHSALQFDEARTYFRRGIALVTHIFNAMPGLHHRSPGLVGAALVDPCVCVSLIADGRHVHPAVVRLVGQLARDRLILVTDAVSAAGCPDGTYKVAGRPVISEGGTVRTRDGVLAGSTLTALMGLSNLAAWREVPLTEVLPSMTTRPAALIGRSDIGRLAKGACADFLILDPNGELLETYVGGALVWQRDAA